MTDEKGCPLGGPRCPRSICDCFIEEYPDDPLGLHPEAFMVATPTGWFRPPPIGWFTFGSLIDYDGPSECSVETGEDGLPLWERPCPPPPV